MNRKFTSLAGGLAVAALVVGGSVAASAAGSTQTEKVGYFEVQSETNPTPAGWFSEEDDGIEAISFNRDAVIFAADSKAVGINKIVDTPYTPGIDMAIEADPTAAYSVVLRSDEVTYLRITATDGTLDSWIGTGYFTDEGRADYVKTQSLDEWAAEDFLGGGVKIHQIGARHHSGEGEGKVRSLTFDGTTYDFGLVQDVTPYSQAEYDDALKTVPAGYVTQSELKAANDKIADLEAKLAETEKALAKAERATDKASDRALKAQARAPYRITGSAKAGNKLRVKGKSYKGVNVKYQWYVGGKKAGKKATLKLKKAHANKRVRVVVKKSYRDSANKKVTVKQTIHLTSKARVSR